MIHHFHDGQKRRGKTKNHLEKMKTPSTLVHTYFAWDAQKKRLSVSLVSISFLEAIYLSPGSCDASRFDVRSCY